MARNAAQNAAQSFFDDEKEANRPKGNRTPKDPGLAKEKKIGTSFFVSPANYEAIKRLAGYRNVGIGALMDEALGEFVKAHADELKEWDDLTAKLKSKYRNNL